MTKVTAAVKKTKPIWKWTTETVVEDIRDRMFSEAHKAETSHQAVLNMLQHMEWLVKAVKDRRMYE